jgi:hypothetical protein
MFIFGYDKYDNGVLEPNGLIGQDKSPEIYRLYLPPGVSNKLAMV